MHFWIDKRSSQLHNYGGGGGRSRVPGAGGFYNRTFGNRAHHPPPLIRNQYPHHPTSNVPVSGQLLIGLSNRPPLPPGLNEPTHVHWNANTGTVGLDSLEQQQQQQQLSDHTPNSFLFHGQLVRNNELVGEPHPAANHHDHDPSRNNPHYTGYRETNGHSFPYNPNRRSSRPTHGRRSSRSASASGGSTGRCRPSWNNTTPSTYDPYNNIQRSQEEIWSHWPPPTNDPATRIYENPMNPTLPFQPRPPSSAAAPMITTTTTTTTTQALPIITTTTGPIDPSWKRTKRIGLTLCFMAFILLSAVAAKFVIEGPWLIDRQPRTERAEATIYFFLTELIFLVFAMALFFAGVTCLRKRTNAYLLRQFNQYIMQSNGGRAEGHMDFFEDGGGSGSPPPPSAADQRSSSSTSYRNGSPPSGFLENHLMNMHINVGEATSFMMSGLSKPPPYHIALYLPVPEENGRGKVEVEAEMKPTTSTAWLDSECNGPHDNKPGDKTEEEEGEEVEEGEVSGPRGKKKKKTFGDEVDGGRGSETPPPPYPHLD